VSPHLSTLRAIRDNYLVAVPGGKHLVASYYAHASEMVGFLEKLRSLLRFNSSWSTAHGSREESGYRG
jgi:hypothetical protein